MMAKFCKSSFDVAGDATVVFADGRVYHSQYPLAVWKWLKGKKWQSVSITDVLGQTYGWDRV